MEPNIACVAGAMDVSLRGEVPVITRNRHRDFTEIAVAYGLILAVIWTPKPWQNLLWWIALFIVARFSWRSFEGRKATGLQAANFLRSFWVVGASLAIAVVAVMVGTRLHTLRFTGGPVQIIKAYWVYALFSGAQQFLMQCFFLARLVRLLTTARQAVFAATGLFALAHVPNPFLIVVTVLWGLVACFTFLRYRNLWTVAIAHAILGITIAITIPGPIDHNMRVGLGYLKYHRPSHRLN